MGTKEWLFARSLCQITGVTNMFPMLVLDNKPCRHDYALLIKTYVLLIFPVRGNFQSGSRPAKFIGQVTQNLST